MAKTINLTVKVDDADFNQFIKNFNAFTATVGLLNKQFQQINATVNKTQNNIQGLFASVKSLNNALSTSFSWAQKIGKSFLRWGTAIGGIVTMLSTGAGMFGVDRLADSIMQKRRQAMGLGTTRGGLVGAEIGGQTLFNDPRAVLSGLRTALGGGAGAGAIAGMGVNPGAFGGDAAKALPPFLRGLHRELQRAAPGTEVAVGRSLTEQQGLSGFSDEDFVRIKKFTKEQLELEILRMDQIRKETEMSDQAQKNWSDLSIMFAKAKTAIESAFGERFKELTKPLGELSDAVVKLVQALLESKTVTDIINWLTTQLNKLTSTLKEDPEAIKKEIEKWDKYIEEEWMPVLKKLGDALTGFADVITKMEERWQDLVRFWKNPVGYMWGKYGPGWGSQAPGSGGTTPPGSTPQQGMPGTPSGPSSGPTVPNRNVPQDPVDPLSGAPLPSPPANPPAQNPPAQSPPATAPPIPPTRSGQLFMPGNFINQTFASNAGDLTQMARATMVGAPGVVPGGNMGGSIAMGSNTFAMGGNINQVAGGRNFAGSRGITSSIAMAGFRGGDTRIGDINRAGDLSVRGGNRRSGMFASIRGGNRIAMFGGAARERIPRPDMNFRGGPNISVASNTDNRRGLSMLQGPLDVDNWQMNRTPSLTVRNVPGSNIFMQSTGMG